MGRHPCPAKSILTKRQGQNFIRWKIPWSCWCSQILCWRCSFNLWSNQDSETQRHQKDWFAALQRRCKLIQKGNSLEGQASCEFYNLMIINYYTSLITHQLQHLLMQRELFQVFCQMLQSWTLQSRARSIVQQHKVKVDLFWRIYFPLTYPYILVLGLSMLKIFLWKWKPRLSRYHQEAYLFECLLKDWMQQHTLDVFSFFH